MLIHMKLFFMDLWLTLLWPWTVASIWLFMGVLTKNSERIWRVFSAHVFSQEEIKHKFWMSQLKTQMKQIWCLWVKIDMLVIIIIPNLKPNFVQINKNPCPSYTPNDTYMLQDLARRGFNFHHTHTRICASHTCICSVLWKILLTSCLLAYTLLAPKSPYFKHVRTGNCTRTLILCMHKNEATLSFYSSN